jgi:hypothetical protein
MLALQLQWDINNEMASVERAAREQQKYEMEDRRLAVEREALTVAFPKPFQCVICLDDHPEDSVARIGQCKHPFCRTCLREYIRSKLSEHVYPMFCPICVAEQGISQPSRASSFVISYAVGIMTSPLQLSTKVSSASSGLQRRNTAFLMNYRSRLTRYFCIVAGKFLPSPCPYNCI